MGFLQWAITNWFDLVQTGGIVAGLFFTAASLRLDAKARRVGNLMAITKNHREIWSQIYERPELARVTNSASNLEEKAMTSEEDLFVRLLILHLNSVYHGLRAGLLLNLDGLARDVRWFFSLPIPMAVWRKMRPVQDADFVRFVELGVTETAGQNSQI